MGKEELKYLKENNYTVHQDLEGKSVVIYGAGALFEEAFKKYDFSKLNIIGISDRKFADESTSPSHFCSLKTIAPDKIKDYKPDCILIAVKEYKNLFLSFTKEYPNTIIRFFMHQNKFDVFKSRNLNPVTKIQINGLHNKKKNKNNYSDFKKNLIEFTTKFNHFCGKIDIPQIEFAITTKCTLRCKHCCNYIPEITADEHCITNIDDFKKQLTNLLKAVNNIHNLILIGGEPLLVKNLHEYLEFACTSRQVKNVWIVTNGTLLMKSELMETIKKYHNKVTVWLSNYSGNTALLPRLKHEEILNQIKQTGADYDYIKDLNWSYTSEINTIKLRDDSKAYFNICGNNCVSVFGGKIYVCPRAGIFDIKKIYTPTADEIIDLNINSKPKLLRNKIKQFYSKSEFTACNYCTVLEDKTQSKVTPALQKD